MQASSVHVRVGIQHMCQEVVKFKIFVLAWPDFLVFSFSHVHELCLQDLAG